MVRIVVEIPHAFAAHCQAMGDTPAGVLLDLIDEFMDDLSGRENNSAPPGSTAALTIPDIAELLREPS